MHKVSPMARWDLSDLAVFLPVVRERYGKSDYGIGNPFYTHSLAFLLYGVGV